MLSKRILKLLKASLILGTSLIIQLTFNNESLHLLGSIIFVIFCLLLIVIDHLDSNMAQIFFSDRHVGSYLLVVLQHQFVGSLRVHLQLVVQMHIFFGSHLTGRQVDAWTLEVCFQRFQTLKYDREMGFSLSMLVNIKNYCYKYVPFCSSLYCKQWQKTTKQNCNLCEGQTASDNLERCNQTVEYLELWYQSVIYRAKEDAIHWSFQKLSTIIPMLLKLCSYCSTVQWLNFRLRTCRFCTHRLLHCGTATK